MNTILLLLLLFNFISCKHLRDMTCVLKGEKLYFYGGQDNSIYNRNIYSVKLEGLELQYQKAKWTLEAIIEGMPDMDAAKGFILNDNSDEIFNFGHLSQIFAFNTLNIKNYKLKNETKGLENFLKILNLPSGFNSEYGLDLYKFIQNDINKSKFYLIDARSKNLGKGSKFYNILTYDALRKTWKDTKLLFHLIASSMTFTYNGLIYNIPFSVYNRNSINGYVINLEKSKIIKFATKGDLPLNHKNYYYVKAENQVFYFGRNKDSLFLEVYILNLDTLVWKKQKFKGIIDQSYSCIRYYKDYIIITLGDDQDNEHTQIIDTKTWKKVYSINPNKSNIKNILSKQIEDNKEGNNNLLDNNKEEGINKSALIGGLVGSGVFIGLIIIIVYFYFKKQKELNAIKPPEFITQHEIIDTLNIGEDKKPLSFRFSIKSNESKTHYNWDLKHPEAIYIINKKQD